MVNIGDLFYESWGYDQTNIDFCQIIKLSPTGKTAICRMTGKRQVTDSTVAPNEATGPEFRLKVDYWEGRDGLKGTYPFVVQDGQAKATRFGYFSKYESPVYETPFGIGH